jgi:uncharacterized protein (TIGR01777 family)
MKEKVIITGGSGLVGGYLTDELIKMGIGVIHLSTRANYKAPKGVEAYLWDPRKSYVDPDALVNAKAIFHLAGASVSKRWTPSYKQEILNSRIQSTQTLKEGLRNYDHKVEFLISASAVGYYPSSIEKEYHEEDAPAHDFLASVTQHWEKHVRQLGEELNLKTASLRIGIVLSRKGGVLQQMEPIFKMGLGTPLGSGDQWMSWIHAEDLARQFIHVWQNQLTGKFNAGGPLPMTNLQFSKELSRAINRPFLFSRLGAPGFMLKLFLGEMGTLALMSQKVSDQKIKNTGFEYKYPSLQTALKNLYS